MTKTWTQENVDTLEAVDTNSGKNLILHNDDFNTFDWVIECLVDICKHSYEQAEQCSLLVHFKGKCAVKEGEEEKLKPLKDGLTDRGLSATIE